MTTAAKVLLMGVVEGRQAESQSDAVIDAVNPSTGERCWSIPAGCDADAERAVASARQAFDDGRWSGAPPSFRKKALHAFADIIEENAAQLDRFDAEEMGKPVSVGFSNAASAAGLMRFYAEAVDKIAGDVYCSDKHSFAAQRRVPRGVAAAIAPWNFPTYVAVLKIAPALAAGNCVVLKPSELSSRSAVELAQFALRAGIPAGVLNVVLGRGETVGRALGLHHGVDILTFTGSSEVGKQMLHYSAQSNMKVVMAECGGKSPQIIFGDGVDLDAAAERVARLLLTNQGQICSVGSRLLVQRSVEGAMVDKIATRMKQIVLGNALDPKTTYGPVASARQCERVMRYIESAESEGAQLIGGGRRVLQDSGGFFVEPTTFRGVQRGAKIAQEEIFGPVLAIMPFDDEADAIQLANSTRFGLVAYIWTASLSTAMRMANGIRSSVTINAVATQGERAGYAASSEPSGESGIGVEGGMAGMENYLRRQLVMISHS